jgi:hypothetical protein
MPNRCLQGHLSVVVETRHHKQPVLPGGSRPPSLARPRLLSPIGPVDGASWTACTAVVEVVMVDPGERSSVPVLP